MTQWLRTRTPACARRIEHRRESLKVLVEESAAIEATDTGPDPGAATNASNQSGGKSSAVVTASTVKRIFVEILASVMVSILALILNVGATSMIFHEGQLGQNRALLPCVVLRHCTCPLIITAAASSV